MAGRAMVVAEAATVEARDMAATVRDLETSGSRQAGNSRLLAMKKSPDCGQPVIISETAITERPEIRWTAWENMSIKRMLSREKTDSTFKFEVKVEYRNTWEPVCDTIRGFTAVIFQHEIDHLNGILFTDKMIKE